MPQPHDHPAMPHPTDDQPPLQRVAVRDLMAGAEVVILVHNGQEYRLRLTRANKLILTK